MGTGHFRSNTRAIGPVITTTLLVASLTGCQSPSPQPEGALSSTASATTATAEPAKKTPTPTPNPTQTPFHVDTAYTPFGHFLIKDDGSEGAYPLVNGTANLYVIGRGPVTLSAETLLPGKEVIAESYTSFGKAEKPMLAGAIKYREPAAGLDPEKYVTVLLAIDPTTGNIIKQTEILRADTTFTHLDVLTGSAGDAVAFSLTTPATKGIEVTAAYDAVTGTKLWERAGNGKAAVTGALAVESEGKGVNFLGAPCSKATGVDIATGMDLYTVDFVDLTEGCLDVNIGASTRSGFMSGQSEGQKYVRVHGRTDRSFNALTGASVTLPDQLWGVDPLTSLVVGSPAQATESAPLIVSDAATGEAKFTLDAARVRQLKVKVLALYAGKLYLQTTDQRLVVDVATGKTLSDDSQRYPVAVVGKWTYWGDGTLEPAP